MFSGSRIHTERDLPHFPDFVPKNRVSRIREFA